MEISGKTKSGHSGLPGLKIGPGKTTVEFSVTRPKKDLFRPVLSEEETCVWSFFKNTRFLIVVKRNDLMGHNLLTIQASGRQSIDVLEETTLKMTRGGGLRKRGSISFIRMFRAGALRGIILVAFLVVIPTGASSTLVADEVDRCASCAHNATSTRELLLVAAGWDADEASWAAVAGSGSDCGVDTVVVISTDSAPDLLSDVLDPFIHANAANTDPGGKGRAAAGDVLVLVVGGGGEEALDEARWRDLALVDSVAATARPCLSLSGLKE
jgi:hypothetical protein